jgi:hypothetical protein
MPQPEPLAGSFRSDEQEVIQDSPLSFTDAQAVDDSAGSPSSEAICQERRSFGTLLCLPRHAGEQSHGADIGHLRCDSTLDLLVCRIASRQENLGG